MSHSNKLHGCDLVEDFMGNTPCLEDAPTEAQLKHHKNIQTGLGPYTCSESNVGRDSPCLPI